MQGDRIGVNTLDPMGKSWEYESILGLPHILRYPCVAPAFTRKHSSKPVLSAVI
jgi:hypothetical protein